MPSDPDFSQPASGDTPVFGDEPASGDATDTAFKHQESGNRDKHNSEDNNEHTESQIQ